MNLITGPKQAMAIGIYFDHLKENHHAWLFCTIINILSFLLFVTTYDIYMYIERRSAINFILFVASGVTQSGLYVQTAITFTILIRAIYMRFAAINEFFRYFVHFIWLFSSHLQITVVHYFIKTEINFSMEICNECRLTFIK